MKSDPGKRSQARPERPAAQVEAVMSEEAAAQGTAPATGQLPAHSTAASLRRSMVNRMQRSSGNRKVQRLVTGRRPAHPLRQDVTIAPAGPGQALPAPVQARMEQGLGADFSDVRVHTDGQAERIGALAFATGDDLHFAAGQYDPDSKSGQELIGHELTHVVQQREGRVAAEGQAGGTTQLVESPELEREADERGAKAADAPERGPGRAATPAAQRQPVAQGFLPAAGAGLSAIGAALSSATAAQAATVVATGLAVASSVQVGQSVQPGTSGVQTVQLPNPWISNVDRQKLVLITQYRLINRYVEQWLAAHPDAPRPSTQAAGSSASAGGGPGAPGSTSAPPATPPQTSQSAPAPAPAPTAPAAPAPGPADSGSQVDTAVLEAVKAEVQLQLEMALNANQRSANTTEFIWSDSGASDEDWIGTVGAIQFEEVRGTFLREMLELRGEAAHIRGLVPPMRGQEMEIRMLRGGRLARSPRMTLGYGDDLAINLDGAGPTIDEADNGSHGAHTYATSWNWDGNTTRLRVKVQIGADGTPQITEVGREGEPRDYSGSRLMPWNWFG